MVQQQGLVAPSASQIKIGSSGLCFGNTAQTEGQSDIEISCSLEVGTNYEFWVVLDLNSAGSATSKTMLSFSVGNRFFFIFLNTHLLSVQKKYCSLSKSAVFDTEFFSGLN